MVRRVSWRYILRCSVIPGWQPPRLSRFSHPIWYSLPSSFRLPLVSIGALTTGPHIAWRTGTPRGALDFAPITGEPPCAISTAWVTASAPGLVVRSERGVVALDLDGDGREETGWVLIYMHIAERDRVTLGTWVETDTSSGASIL